MLETFTTKTLSHHSGFPESPSLAFPIWFAGGVGSSVIAIIGTLAGTCLAFTFQMVLARRARREALADRGHIERREACAALGAAMAAYRHSQIARRSHKNTTHSDSPTLKHEVRLARGDAWAAFFRLELLSDDAALRLEAENCMERIRLLKDADEQAALELKGAEARRAIHDLMRRSRDRLLRPD